MRKDSFRVARHIEVEYQRAISSLFRSLMPLIDQGETLEGWLGRFEQLSYQSNLLDLSTSLSGKMIRWVNMENAKSWREASRASQQSEFLYRLLQKEMEGSVGERVRQLTDENAQYITSLPYTVSRQLSHEILRAQQAGSRPETIAKMMTNRFPELTQGRIHLLARTQTSTASTLLTEARSEDLGIAWYIWRTSKDQRVRHSHAHMEDVLVRWRDPASPEALVGIKSSLGHYAPGAAPNDRCYPEPMLHVDDVSWPHRVYADGHIARMTKSQFMKFAGIPVRRIAA